MRFKKLHPLAQLPTQGSAAAGGYDLYMPEAGSAVQGGVTSVALGFAAEVPPGHVALLLPRSGAGSRGCSLVNTCGVIDADYRGEWIAKLEAKHRIFQWQAGERALQFILVPVATVIPAWADELSDTSRGTGGFGSSG